MSQSDVARSERELARRMAWEREKRGWTFRDLASRMQEAGCMVHHTALYKIEDRDKPRRINYEEVVAAAEAFDMSVAELLRPLSAVLNEEVASVLNEEEQALRGVWEAVRRYQNACRRSAELEERAKDPTEMGLAEAIDAFEVGAGDGRTATPDSNASGGLRKALEHLAETPAEMREEVWLEHRIGRMVEALTTRIRDIASGQASGVPMSREQSAAMNEYFERHIDLTRPPAPGRAYKRSNGK